MKSDASCLLRVLLDLIVDIRLIDELVTTIESLLWVMEPSPLLPMDAGFLRAANDSGVQSMLNSVQTLPAIEVRSLGSSDHLLSPQATLPRRAAKARPLRVTGFGSLISRSDFRLNFKSFFHSFRVLDEAAAMCFFAKGSEEKMRDRGSSIKALDTLVIRGER